VEAYRIDRFGSVDGIVLRSNEDPRPGLREILMRVRASSLNYRDLMVLKGGAAVRRSSASCRYPTARARPLQSATA
jgi:NADPH:quinone reductase-like Zn-dependent oxidoreductase